MKIIILGAGQVGSTVAHNLANEDNDITVVDQSAELLKSLRDRVDIQIVVGHAARPDVLLDAGIEDADLILAVTNSDETNMVACQIAYTLFHTPTRLARVRAPEYLTHPQLFSASAIPIDFIISPEELVTSYIQRLIRQPGALQILDFSEGKVQMAVVCADHQGEMVGHPVRELKPYLKKGDARVVAIFRQGRAVIPDGDTTIEVGDEVFFLAARQHIPSAMRAFRQADKPNRRLIIAGGGNIGERLARLLETTYRVKVIERNPDRCRQLAESMHRAIILKGDAADADLLVDENIEDTDIFCAVTNDDEANILSSMLAKRMGAHKVISIINRASYVDLAEGAAVDIAVSPALVTISALLAHVRRGDVVAVHSLRRGAAEAMEVIAHGDTSTSKVVGRRINDLPLPSGTTIGAIIRGDDLVFPHDDTLIESDDHVIIFLTDKSRIDEVEKLFQVAITFL